MLLLFFVSLTSFANAFLVHRFAIGGNVGQKWNHETLLRRGKEQKVSNYQGEEEEEEEEEEERRTIHWTERDLVSDDPIERRLLPLVKKILESDIPEVAASGPELFCTLRDFKPVRSRWVNDAMKRWREHPDPHVHSLHRPCQNARVIHYKIGSCHDRARQKLVNDETHLPLASIVASASTREEIIDAVGLLLNLVEQGFWFQKL